MKFIFKNSGLEHKKTIHMTRVFLVAVAGLFRRNAQSEWTSRVCFTKKSSVRCALFLFTSLFFYESKLSSHLEMQKASHF